MTMENLDQGYNFFQNLQLIYKSIQTYNYRKPFYYQLEQVNISSTVPALKELVSHLCKFIYAKYLVNTAQASKSSLICLIWRSCARYDYSKIIIQYTIILLQKI